MQLTFHGNNKLYIDHINGCRTDDRLTNLRSCTQQQNNFNKIKKKGCSSKYKGVSWLKNYKKWMCYIGFNGKRRILGYFDDEVEAAKTYDKAAKKYHKEFARLNFE